MVWCPNTLIGSRTKTFGTSRRTTFFCTGTDVLEGNSWFGIDVQLLNWIRWFRYWFCNLILELVSGTGLVGLLTGSGNELISGTDIWN